MTLSAKVLTALFRAERKSKQKQGLLGLKLNWKKSPPAELTSPWHHRLPVPIYTQVFFFFLISNLCSLLASPVLSQLPIFIFWCQSHCGFNFPCIGWTWELTSKQKIATKIDKYATWLGYMLRIFLFRAAWLSLIHLLEMIKVIKLISEARIPRLSSEKDNDEAKRKSGNPGGAFLSTESQASVFRVSE